MVLINRIYFHEIIVKAITLKIMILRYFLWFLHIYIHDLVIVELKIDVKSEIGGFLKTTICFKYYRKQFILFLL